ncbi:uncharacterized protein LOC127607133 [Hippocampus zosterae]|uniref:uncharacterized protein LOC127607133 n=1 Tax=Hippocampus zosterae TaxID=109293 RepID=UPI00223CA0C7|nr:uncharacterized protein LOC127607133 [Hippocampus zosterae]XP_051931203.1 uncharacterized protein LOC127607133 [Hippocampus zosterae]XP_051931204.1 uncharacterized protein LOC127607133 [Hippocampus zosterae]
MTAIKASAPLFESPASSEDEGDMLAGSNHVFDTENYLLRCQTSSITKPEMTLLVEGIPTVFLVDTGADITVLGRWDRDTVKPSDGKIHMKGAHGSVQPLTLSQTVTITSPTDPNRKALVETALNSRCPHNLLGRDAQTQLEIYTIVNHKGQVEARMGNSQDDARYFWTLDLPNDDVTRSSECLVRLAGTKLKPGGNMQTANNLHVTIRRKQTPGPDPDYTKVFLSLHPQGIVVEHVYWKDQWCFATARVGRAVKPLLSQGQHIFIPLGKPEQCEWKNMNNLASSVPNHLWSPSPANPGCEETQDGWVRQYINWEVMTTPTVHFS